MSPASRWERPKYATALQRATHIARTPRRPRRKETNTHVARQHDSRYVNRPDRRRIRLSSGVESTPACWQFQLARMHDARGGRVLSLQEQRRSCRVKSRTCTARRLAATARPNDGPCRECGLGKQAAGAVRLTSKEKKTNRNDGTESGGEINRDDASPSADARLLMARRKFLAQCKHEAMHYSRGWFIKALHIDCQRRRVYEPTTECLISLNAIAPPLLLTTL